MINIYANICIHYTKKRDSALLHNFSYFHANYSHMSCCSVLTLLLLLVVLRTDDWVSSEAGSWSWRSRGGGRLDSRVRLRARWVW